MQKMLDFSSQEQRKIKAELGQLKEALNLELDEFDGAFKEAMASVLKSFRNEKRGSLSDLKTIKAQV